MLFSGALRHIRSLHPGAHITLAVKPHIVSLVERCPYIDACVPTSSLTWWDSKIKYLKIPYIKRFERAIRYINRTWNSVFGAFDIIIFPVKSPTLEHLSIIRELNTKRSFGITGCDINTKDGYHPMLHPQALLTDQFDISDYDPWRHELLTTLDFLKYLGCEVSDINDIKPEVWVTDTDKNLLEKIQDKSQKIIGFFPAASLNEKCWSPENYEAIARSLGEKIFVIFGGPADVIIADQVASFLVKGSPKAKVINMVGKTTLKELYKTISACSLVISMDTSGLHLAIAAGVPTIAIVGGWHYGRFVPYGNPDKHIFLTKKLECFHCNGCNRDNKVNRYECLQGVLPQRVISAVQLLQAKSASVSTP